ncbi:uncharacterized protein MICPUCDRAFT_67051 [Micromonas pusilla CCMP1545]|uniref:Predicted protein n=1 Tax=Micromonas pusilla (strain CCMP1545) TaxID=564608 RepID=C1MPH6_MICPC|nr:uncharacterized protein MICPUCDRAFT_67051 [Micromonas pusilla CCMP1545]EEH57910.1 predicted protein [Micromonas pusilla CCMP1545]|eukprot:XP_003057959.1 predicted protein [Micromonas pusilla CCMP1545]
MYIRGTREREQRDSLSRRATAAAAATTTTCALRDAASSTERGARERTDIIVRGRRAREGGDAARSTARATTTRRRDGVYIGADGIFWVERGEAQFFAAATARTQVYNRTTKRQPSEEQH